MNRARLTDLNALDRLRELRIRSAQAHERTCHAALERAQHARDQRQAQIKAEQHQRFQLLDFLSGKGASSVSTLIGSTDARRDVLEASLQEHHRLFEIEQQALCDAHARWTAAVRQRQTEQRRKESVQLLLKDTRKLMHLEAERRLEGEAEDCTSPGLGLQAL